MPRDPRLWMPFPNDFWMHPKIAPLSDAAFRAFVEMIGYSRMQDLDGLIPVSAARRQWKPKAIAELLKNHPERPSLSVDGEHYVIWNYSEHQETRETREARQQISRDNGAKGGRPPGTNPRKTRQVTQIEPVEKQSQSSETDKTDQTHLSSVRTDPTARAELDEEIESLAEAARAVGVRNLPRVMRALERVVGPVSPSVALDTTRAVVLLATAPVKLPEPYLEAACLNSPETVRGEWKRVADAAPKPGQVRAALDAAAKAVA